MTATTMKQMHGAVVTSPFSVMSNFLPNQREMKRLGKYSKSSQKHLFQIKLQHISYSAFVPGIFANSRSKEVSKRRKQEQQLVGWQDSVLC